jgi:hypothetical protein
MPSARAAAVVLTVLSACGWAGGDSSRPDPAVSGFSGRAWHVKQFETAVNGPGPNYFSPSRENVWLDAQGFLHLRITQRDGRWYCAEVITDQVLGYGTYIFTVGSRADTLDPNVVLGMFTWDETGTVTDPATFRELDLEFSRWGASGNADFQFVVQPWLGGVGNIHRFNVDTAAVTDSIHVFAWSAAGTTFTSAHGSTWPPDPADVVDTWSYSGGANPVPGSAQARINLWLLNGAAPQNGQAQEVVIKRFQFLPP